MKSPNSIIKSTLLSFAALIKVSIRSFPSGTSCAWKSDAMAKVRVFSSCCLQAVKLNVNKANRIYFVIVQICCFMFLIVLIGWITIIVAKLICLLLFTVMTLLGKYIQNGLYTSKKCIIRNMVEVLYYILLSVR